MSVFAAVALLAHSTTRAEDAFENLATNDFHAFLTKTVASKGQIERESVPEDPIASKAGGGLRPFVAGMPGVVLGQLLSYPVTLPGLTASDDKLVEQNASLLQDFRDMLRAEPGYDNLLIADTVDRVLVASLSRRIVAAGTLSPGIKAQVQRLHAVHVGTSQMACALVPETDPASGTALPGEEEPTLPELPRATSRTRTTTDQANEQQLKEFYRLLMKASGTKSLESALTKRKVARRASLLGKKDVSALLMAIWETDSYVHLSLPLLAAYVEKCPDFHQDDDYGKIKKVLNLSTADRKRYGSYLTPSAPGAEDEARRLLQQVQQGEIDSFLGLQDAQEKVASKPSKDHLVRKALGDIEGAKAQIKLLRSLSPGTAVSMADIRAYLRKDVFIPEDGGEYHVGTIGQPATFIRSDGEVIFLGK